MAKPAQEPEVTKSSYSDLSHMTGVCARVNRFECCEEQDGERANKVMTARLAFLVLCGPELMPSPWTTAQNKSHRTEDTA